MNTIKLILISFILLSFFYCASNKEKAFDSYQYMDRFNDSNTLIIGTPQYKTILKNNVPISYVIENNLPFDRERIPDSIWIVESEDSIVIFDRFYEAGSTNRFFIYKDFVNDTVFIRTPILTKAFVEINKEDTSMVFTASPQESIFLLKTKMLKTQEMKKYPVVYKNIKVLN